jgi:hypothetical protein
MRKNPSILYFKQILLGIAFSLLFGNCTQGSIGNSLSEKGFVLQRWIELVNTSLSTVQPVFYLYDDRGDSNLNSFDVISNSTTYSVTLQTSSDLTLVSYSLYLKKSKDLLARDSSKHVSDNTTPEVPTSSESLTNRYYTQETSSSLRFSEFTRGEDDLGIHYKLPVSNSLSVPRGTLTKGIFVFQPKLSLTIASNTYTVSYDTVSVAVDFSCPLTHSGQSSTILPLSFKYSDLFTDSGTLKPIDEAVTNGVNSATFSSTFETYAPINQYDCFVFP